MVDREKLDSVVAEKKDEIRKLPRLYNIRQVGKKEERRRVRRTRT